MEQPANREGKVKISTRIKDSSQRGIGYSRQGRTLLKHFIWRFVHNDFIKYDWQKRTVVTALFFILILTGGYISLKLLSPYAGGSGQPQDSWLDRAYFLVLMMSFTGIISIFNWDKIFLDKKDLHNFLHLPIPRRLIIFAKFSSIFVFVGLISVSFGSLSTVIFPAFLAEQLNVAPIGFGLVHLLTLFLANLFVVLSLASLQGLLMLLLPARAFRRLSFVVQSVLLAGFIAVFAFFPMLYDSMPNFKEKLSAIMHSFPPLWFTGFYDTLLGKSAGGPLQENFYISLLATGLALLLYASLFFIGYNIMLKRTAEGEAGRKPLRLTELFKRVFDSLYFRKNYIEQAIFYFTFKTLRRNRQHAVYLLVFLVLPFGFLLTRLFYLYYENPQVLLYSVNADTLSVPLVLGFFLVLGLRLAVLQPDQLEANWIFQATEVAENHASYVNGLKKFVALLAPIPLFILAFGFHVFSWDFSQALYHGLYVAFTVFLLVEIFFFNYRNIPFTCATYAGKMNLKAWWAAYLALFFAYAWVFTHLELYLMDHPAGFFLYYTLVTGTVYTVRKFQAASGKDRDFIYEEEPQTAMLSLNLGE